MKNIELPTSQEEILLRNFKKSSDYLWMINSIGPRYIVSHLMTHTGISQRRLNALLGVSSSAYVTNIMKGRKRLTLVAAVNLSRICKMNIRERVTLYESLVEQELP